MCTHTHRNFTSSGIVLYSALPNSESVIQFNPSLNTLLFDEKTKVLNSQKIDLLNVKLVKVKCFVSNFYISSVDLKSTVENTFDN